MAPQSIAAIPIDGQGNAATTAVPFDFNSQLAFGDTIAAIAPVFVNTPPSGQPPLTFTAPSLANNVWTVNVTVANGTVGETYPITCTATTIKGFHLIVQVNATLVGLGYSTNSNVQTPTPGSGTTQAPGTVYGGPATGSPAPPGFRPLANTDLPVGTWTAPTSSTGGLPTPGSPGRYYKLTDGNRNIVVDTGTVWASINSGEIDPMLFGAKGIGAAFDDTNAFQAAITATCAVNGTLKPSPPSSYYNFTGQLIAQPVLGQWPLTLRIIGTGRNSQAWRYSGTAKSFFVFLGAYNLDIEGISFVFDNAVTGTACLDSQVYSAQEGTALSQNRNTIRNCSFYPGTGGNNIGLRLNAYSDANGNELASNQANYKLDHFEISAQGRRYGDIGVQVGGSQCQLLSGLNVAYSGCYVGIHNGAITTTLTGDITNSQTTIAVNSTMMFPTAGTIKINSEIITYTGITSQLPAPFLPATPAAATGSSSIPQTTYYGKVTYVNGNGETTGSAEFQITAPANQVLEVFSPEQWGNAQGQGSATGWNVYLGTSSGTETKQNATLLGIGSTWAMPSSGLISGASLPGSNTTGTASFTGCTRGASGSTAASHGSGSTVQQLVAGNNGGVYKGSSDIAFIGGGGTSNAIDLLTLQGPVRFEPTRLETGGRAIQIGVGNHNFPILVTVCGTNFDGYSPPDGTLFLLTGSDGLEVKNSTIVALPVPATGNTFSVKNNQPGAFLAFLNSTLYGASTPYTLNGGTNCRVQIKRVQSLNANGSVTGFLPDVDT